MAGPSNPQTLNKTFLLTDDDDFQDPSPSQLRLPKSTSKIASRKPLGTYNSATPRTFKKPKQNSPHGGKENSVVVGKFTADLDLGRGLDSSRPNKKPKQHPVSAEKGCLSPVVVEKFEENGKSLNPVHQKSETDFEDLELGHGLDTIESTIDCCSGVQKTTNEEELKRGYLFKSIEARLLNSNGGFEERKEEESEECSELDLLLKLCGEEDEVDGDALSADLPRQEECLGLDEEYGLICCPLCGADISDLSGEMRQVHTNECLDKEETPIDKLEIVFWSPSISSCMFSWVGPLQVGSVQISKTLFNHTFTTSGNKPEFPSQTQQPDHLYGKKQVVTANNDASFHCPGQVLNDSPCQSPMEVVCVSPVVEWLRNLGLAKYEEIFVREEIDWDTLKSLTEEDLFSIGVTALGPRRKIISSILELGKETTKERVARQDVTKIVPIDAGTTPSKLITDYFISPVSERKKGSATDRAQMVVKRTCSSTSHKKIQKKNPFKSAKSKDIPVWCSIPGTPFRVDAENAPILLEALRSIHTFVGLTTMETTGCFQVLEKRLFSLVPQPLPSRSLVNLKIGISWDMIQVLPINQKINIAGIDVTCFDANHCPGSLIILFEPPNGKAVLHTGDFRFCEEMTTNSILQTCDVHSLILDTTYCDPQYDFPKQEDVIQFVIESIQAETFNSKTLFLIGSYTIGKERLFVEVARSLQKKVYITASKLSILECLGFTREEMQFFTLNEQESQIHVVPMWTLASFKRLKYVSNQYAGRYSLIVAFSPTGWSFGKGKKKSTGNRWQQGTIIRYEVPYSEHSSFSELKEFVKFISPVNIIPSVNNHGPESSSAMVSRLLD